MTITCTVQTEESYDHMHKLFATELKRRHDRSMITLENTKGKATFHISATDTTALRAAVNSVTSILGMYEKTREAL